MYTHTLSRFRVPSLAISRYYTHTFARFSRLFSPPFPPHCPHAGARRWQLAIAIKLAGGIGKNYLLLTTTYCFLLTTTYYLLKNCDGNCDQIGGRHFKNSRKAALYSISLYKMTIELTFGIFGFFFFLSYQLT